MASASATDVPPNFITIIKVPCPSSLVPGPLSRVPCPGSLVPGPLSRVACPRQKKTAGPGYRPAVAVSLCCMPALRVHRHHRPAGSLSPLSIGGLSDGVRHGQGEILQASPNVRQYDVRSAGL